MGKIFRIILVLVSLWILKKLRQSPLAPRKKMSVAQTKLLSPFISSSPLNLCLFSSSLLLLFFFFSFSFSFSFFFLLFFSFLSSFLFSVLFRFLSIPKQPSVLITGCDTGFGHVSALELAKKGCHVYAGCLTEEGRKTLTAAGLSTLHPFPLDVTSDSDIQACVKMIEAQCPEGLL